MAQIASKFAQQFNPVPRKIERAARVRQQCPYHPIAVAAGAFVWSYRALFSCV